MAIWKGCQQPDPERGLKITTSPWDSYNHVMYPSPGMIQSPICRGSDLWSPSSYPFFPFPPEQLHTTRPLNPWWWCQRAAPRHGGWPLKQPISTIQRATGIEGKTIQNISLVQNVSFGSICFLVFPCWFWTSYQQIICFMSPISSSTSWGISLTVGLAEEKNE